MALNLQFIIEYTEPTKDPTDEPTDKPRPKPTPAPTPEETPEPTPDPTKRPRSKTTPGKLHSASGLRRVLYARAIFIHLHMISLAYSLISIALLLWCIAFIYNAQNLLEWRHLRPPMDPRRGLDRSQLPSRRRTSLMTTLETMTLPNHHQDRPSPHRTQPDIKHRSRAMNPRRGLDLCRPHLLPHSRKSRSRLRAQRMSRQLNIPP